MKRVAVVSLLVLLALAWVAAPAVAKPKPAPEPAGKPWLGVILGEVPAPLASHLGLQAGGVMILNVAKGSPADRAGIEQYDVVILVDKAQVKDAPGLQAALGKLAPGRKIALGILRRAGDRKVAVGLGKAPTDMGQLEYKFKHDQAGPMISRTFVHPPMTLRRGAGGWDWTVPGKTPPWLEDLRKSMPEFPGQMPAAGIKIETVVAMKDANGQTVRISRGQGGQITVIRTGKDGKDKKAVYKNEKELQQKDKPAHEMYKNIHIGIGGVGTAPGIIWRMGEGMPGGLAEKDIRIAIGKAFAGGKGGQFDLDPKKIQEQVDKALKDAGVESKQIQDAIRKALAGGPGGQGNIRVEVRRGGEGTPKPAEPSVRKPSKGQPKVEGKALGKALRGLTPAQRKAVLAEVDRMMKDAFREALEEAAKGDE